jgi:hypothetical protein
MLIHQAQLNVKSDLTIYNRIEMRHTDSQVAFKDLRKFHYVPLSSMRLISAFMEIMKLHIIKALSCETVFFMAPA